jgi:hypothetical protein
MKLLIVFAASVLLVLVGANSRLIGRYSLSKDAANEIPVVHVPPILDQTGEAGPDVKLVLLALLPEGFETSEMRLAPGDYVFIIGNRTGLREVDFRLDRDRNARVAAATLPGRQKDWKQRIRLTTGTYVVTANDNAEWSCRIVVGR